MRTPASWAVWHGTGAGAAGEGLQDAAELPPPPPAGDDAGPPQARLACCLPCPTCQPILRLMGSLNTRLACQQKPARTGSSLALHGKWQWGASIAVATAAPPQQPTAVLRTCLPRLRLALTQTPVASDGGRPLRPPLLRLAGLLRAKSGSTVGGRRGGSAACPSIAGGPASSTERSRARGSV